MTAPTYHQRHARNEESRASAEHHSEPWEGYELELLLEWGGGEEELEELAELLGRTIEACRQRYYTQRSCPSPGRVREDSRVSAPSTPIVWEDDEEWSEWYVRG